MSTLSLDNARVPSVWGRNAAGQSVSRMAVRQGRPWSDNAWSPDAPEQVGHCILCQSLGYASKFDRLRSVTQMLRDDRNCTLQAYDFTPAQHVLTPAKRQCCCALQIQAEWAEAQLLGLAAAQPAGSMTGSTSGGSQKGRTGNCSGPSSSTNGRRPLAQSNGSAPAASNGANGSSLTAGFAAGSGSVDRAPTEQAANACRDGAARGASPQPAQHSKGAHPALCELWTPAISHFVSACGDLLQC